MRMIFNLLGCYFIISSYQVHSVVEDTFSRHQILFARLLPFPSLLTISTIVIVPVLLTPTPLSSPPTEGVVEIVICKYFTDRDILLLQYNIIIISTYHFHIPHRRFATTIL